MKSLRLGGVFSYCLLPTFAVLLLLAAYAPVKAGGDTPSWGFSLSNLDRSCKPCNDFYEFAMGGWMKANPIPAEYARWGTFTELRDKNLMAMRTILEAAAKASAKPETNEQKVSDFYASCMDTSAIEAAGLKPVEGDLARIDAIKERKTLYAEIARLQREGAEVMFRFRSGQDYKDSSKVIAQASQGGLGMPDRDYYLREDDKSKQLRSDYVEHVTKMFELAGDSSEKAAAEAKTVMGIEAALAKASRTRVELRNPEKNYNLMPVSEAQMLTPDWSWENYLNAIGAPA
jgi:putative endopeptidase